MSMTIDFEKVIKQSIEKEIKSHIEKIIEDGKKEIEKNVRGNIGKIVCGFFEHIDFMMDQNRMIITVKFD